MPRIKIKGEIGWDVFAFDVERQLYYATGDLDVEIDSPGGSVYEGFKIFNLLKRYDKGSVTAYIDLAASMGSYIALACSNRILNNNSIVMMHNPAGGVRGDYRAVLNYGSILERLAEICRKEYAKGLGLDCDIVKSYMDSGKYFIGPDELSVWGTVQNSTGTDAPETDASVAKAMAIERINAVNAKMTADFVKDDLDKVAKMLAGPDLGTVVMNANLNSNKDVGLNNQEEKMDLNEFKMKHGDLYAQVMQEGYAKGVEAERKRVQAHMKFLDIAKDDVVKAIDENQAFMDMLPTYTHKQVCESNIQALQQGSPPSLNTEDPTKPDGGESPEQIAAKAEIEAALKAKGLRD